jgi:hypothetical protein
LAFWHTFTYNYISKIENCFYFLDIFFVKIQSYIFFSIATRPGEHWYRYCGWYLVARVYRIFFSFFVEGGRLFVFSLFTAAVCLQFFYSFKISLYVTDCVLCPSYGIHTWFNISRALTFVFTEFFLFILVQFFCFVFNFWWASSSTKKILRILILDRKCWGQIDIFGFWFYISPIFVCFVRGTHI